jgi:choline kinase
MKAVLLAAGTATRLRPLTDRCPKCLLDVGGASILRRALGHLQDEGIHDVVLVTGFLEGLIHDAARSWFPTLKLHLVSNPDFATTNNAYSLLLAREAVGGDAFVLLDSDIVFDPDVLGRVMRAPHESALALRPAKDLGDEEIKCEVDGQGRVRQIGKHVPPPQAAGESIGIERFGPRTARRLFEILESRVRGRGLVNEYYEASFQELIDEGGELHAVGVDSLFCMEIDTAADLERARAAYSKT